MTQLDSHIQNLLSQGRLQEARRLGEQAVASQPDNQQFLRLLINVYLETGRQCIENNLLNYLPQIDARLDELIGSLQHPDDSLTTQRRHLSLASLPGYKELSALESLSARDGHEGEAMEQARQLLNGPQPLDPRLHEIVATIMHRHLRVLLTLDDSRPARALLSEFLPLTHPRPSRIHSLMLRTAIRVARRFPDFNFARFLEMWNPRFMRPDDIHDPDGKRSLASIAIETVIDSDSPEAFPRLLEMIPAPNSVRMDLVTEALHSIAAKALHNNDSSRAIDILELYSRHGSFHTRGQRHSAMLSLALKAMQGPDQWRFPEFLVNWDASFFTTADLPASTDNATPSLASRALSRAFHALRQDLPRHSHLLPALSAAWDTVASLSPFIAADPLNAQRRALLTAWMGATDDAIDRLSSIARSGNCTASFWNDFAEIAPTPALQLSITALGLTRTPLDDPHRDLLQRHFTALQSRLNSAVDEPSEPIAAEPEVAYGKTPLHVDKLHILAAPALDLIYRSTLAVKLCVVDRQGAMLHVTDGITSPYYIDTTLWPAIANVANGTILDCRRDNTGIVALSINPDGSPYDILPLHHAIVTAPGLARCARKPSDITIDPSIPVGTFITARVWHDGTARRGIDPQPVPMARARAHFDRITVALTALNDSIASYSAGPDGPDGNLDPSLLPDDANVGTALDIYYYRLADNRLQPVSVTHALNPDSCQALRQLSGLLTTTSTGSWAVRDIYVDPSLLPADLTPNTYVTLTALYNPHSNPRWQAITLSTY